MYAGRDSATLALKSRDELAREREECCSTGFTNDVHRPFNGRDMSGVIEPTAGAEPDPGRFKELVDLCKEKKVRVIAVEPQFPSNKAAKALLDEIRAKGVPDPAFVEVDPIETAPPDELGPDYYEKKMRANLANLAKVMK